MFSWILEVLCIEWSERRGEIINLNKLFIPQASINRTHNCHVYSKTLNSQIVFFWLHALSYTSQGMQREPGNLILKYNIPIQTFLFSADFWIH